MTERYFLYHCKHTYISGGAQMRTMEQNTISVCAAVFSLMTDSECATNWYLLLTAQWYHQPEMVDYSGWQCCCTKYTDTTQNDTSTKREASSPWSLTSLPNNSNARFTSIWNRTQVSAVSTWTNLRMFDLGLYKNWISSHLWDSIWRRRDCLHLSLFCCAIPGGHSAVGVMPDTQLLIHTDNSQIYSRLMADGAWIPAL